MKGIPGIKEFPSDNRYWRLEWFGAVQLEPDLPVNLPRRLSSPL